MQVDFSKPDCNVCGEITNLTCGKCHIATYCGRECQTEDWSHQHDPHSVWCFDRKNPDVDHLEMLIEACLQRRKSPQYLEDHYDDPEGLKEDEEDTQDVEAHGFDDVNQAIEWLDIEMQDPFDIGGIVDTLRTAGYNRRIRQQKRKQFSGRVKQGKGVVSLSPERFKEGSARRREARAKKRALRRKKRAYKRRRRIRKAVRRVFGKK